MSRRAPTYPYCALQEGYIRVMTVKGASAAAQDSEYDVVVCTLEQVPLAEANPFCALSYVWGGPEKTLAICLDGHEFLVRENLGVFLRSLRNYFRIGKGGASFEFELRLWVDYVCINQQDLVERSSQVSMMGDIFRNADGVYAWLGESSRASDELFAHAARSQETRSKHKHADRVVRASTRTSDEEVFTYRDVVERPYWRRLWIKQEYILAKDLWIVCGDNVVNEVDFAWLICPSTTLPGGGAFAWAKHLVHESEKPSTASTQAILALLRARARPAEPEGRLLYESVELYRVAECQDPRDKIYGVLSLASDDVRRRINVDYRKPLLQVLLETYHFWNRRDGDSLIWHCKDVTDSGIGSARIRSYPYTSFASNMAKLLPPAELNALCQLEPLRRAVSGRCVLQGWARPLAAKRYYKLAGVFQNDIVAETDHKHIGTPPGAFVLRVESHHGYSFIVYTDHMPDEQDAAVTFGSNIYFLKQEKHFKLQPISRIHEKLTLTARGTILHNTSHDGPRCLRTLRLPHPCQWLRQQLPDATFQVMGSKSSLAACCGCTDDASPSTRPRTVHLDILCNSAAIVSILRESEAFSPQPPARDRKADQRPPTTAHSPTEELFAEDAQSWSPWEFAVQQKLLEPCCFCLSRSNVVYKLRAHISGRLGSPHEGSMCKCLWKQRKLSRRGAADVPTPEMLGTRVQVQRGRISTSKQKYRRLLKRGFEETDDS